MCSLVAYEVIFDFQCFFLVRLVFGSACFIYRQLIVFFFLWAAPICDNFMTFLWFLKWIWIEGFGHAETLSRGWFLNFFYHSLKERENNVRTKFCCLSFCFWFKFAFIFCGSSISEFFFELFSQSLCLILVWFFVKPIEIFWTVDQCCLPIVFSIRFTCRSRFSFSLSQLFLVWFLSYLTHWFNWMDFDIFRSLNYSM